MPSSTARATFDANRQDIERLLELHEQVSGGGPGRPVGLEVLNKGAIVLTCSIWEAYVEDLASEVIEHYVNHVSDVSKLPKDLRERVAKELREASNKSAPWKLAGEGWKTELKNRLKAFAAQRNTGLNTPKTKYVKDFFATAIGVDDVPSHWSWAGMSAERAGRKLDELVTLRGDIAHRGTASAGGVRKSRVTALNNHVERLADATDTYVNAQVEQSTGTPLFS